MSRLLRAVLCRNPRPSRSRPFARPSLSACLSCRRHTTQPRTPEPPPFPIVSAPSESLLFSSPSAASIQAQSLNHLCRNLLDALPAGLLPERCLQVVRPPGLVKLTKTFQTTQQRTL